MQRKFIRRKIKKEKSEYIMKVREIYDYNVKPVFLDELIIKVKSILKSRGLKQIPVVTNDNKVIGNVDRKRIIRLSQSNFTLLVKDFLSEVKTLAILDSEVKNVAEKMLKNEEDCIPVVEKENNNFYQGILNLENILEAQTKINSELLNEKVENKMKKALSCKSTDPLYIAWEKMEKNSSTGIIVTDEENKVVGILTHYDLLSCKVPSLNIILENNSAYNATSVSAAMNKNVITIKSSTTIAEAAKILLKYGISRLPIINSSNKLIGIIDKETLVKFLLPLL